MIRKIQISTMLIVLSTLALNAQIYNPVSWTFSTKKITNDTYEIHLLAQMDKDWHIYSQDSPETGPLPTKISFEKNRSMILVGIPKEIGKKETKYVKVFDIDVQSYHNKVEFVQIVKFRKKIPESISGVVEYMACKGEQCLPPEKLVFTVKLHADIL